MQKYGIVQVTVAPLRIESADSSEMVSQIMFGELVEVLEENQNWIKIKTIYDSYLGWIDYKQIHKISEQEFLEFNKNVEFIYNKFDFATLNQTEFPLILGCEIRNKIENKIKINNQIFNFEGISKINKFSRENILEVALKYLNIPYLWGGKSTFGIDCSGFTQMCYKICGEFLPRDSYQQAELGQTLVFLEEANIGDLAFFDNSEGKIIHVGIIINDSKIIHAHGKVRIDSLDHSGIFNKELNKYTHKLRLIKNMF